MNTPPVQPADPSATPPRWNAQVFLAAALLNGIVAFSILRADHYYFDDLSRVRSGYTGWTGDGRPLTSLIMQVLNMGAPLTDLTPLPQILGVLALAWCALMLARKFGIQGTAAAAMAAFPLGASPFFLQNLSYKFDVLTMVLAVALTVVAITETPWWGKRAVWGSVLLLGTLCMYQPALNAFLVFAVLEFLLLLWRDEPPSVLWRQALGRTAQAVCAILPYKLIALCVLKNLYAKGHSALLDAEHCLMVLSNLRRYWDLLDEAFSDRGAWALAATLIAGLVMALALGLRYLARSWAASTVAGRALRLLLALSLPVAWALATLGPLVFLREITYAPRVMVGIGALACSSLLLICVVAQQMRLPRMALWAVLVVPVYSMLLLAEVYGNALVAQARYEHSTSASLADDFAELAARSQLRGQPLTHYVLHGSAEHAPVLDVAMEQYPFLGRLVPVYLQEGWGWMADLFSQYDVNLGMDNLPGGLGGTISRMCEAPAVRITADYRLYIVGSRVVVAFNDVPPCPSELRAKRKN